MVKKYFALLVLCLYVLGAVGGFGFPCIKVRISLQ